MSINPATVAAAVAIASKSVTVHRLSRSAPSGPPGYSPLTTHHPPPTTHHSHLPSSVFRLKSYFDAAMGAIITGTGIAVPDQVVTNQDLTRIMDTSDDWITSRTGVRERRFVEEGVGSAELGVQAAREAMAAAAIQPDQVDALVTATMTPDYLAPGISALVQHGLGLPAVAAFDLRQQCSGFLYALDLADSLIGSGRAETVVLVGTEVHGGFLPWGASFDVATGRANREATPAERERNTRFRSWSVLFGDGAGAMVMRRGGEQTGVLATSLHTDGGQFNLIHVPGVGFRRRPYVDHGQLDGELHLPIMDGAGLYRQAVRLMPEAVREVAKAVGVEVDEIDLVVAHQANDRILEGVRKQLGMTQEKVPSNIARYGNTTAATLPLLFHELRQAGKVKPGMLVCFTSFGAGAHWGAVLYREP
ncbi:MAG TPA: 3-oxoacyl-[acyl-carrier-protein] synthase III C-terminal domain-containing protein [Acidimicrobiia bacterium]|nr:3-oxoacyl-[acyl-carrier-protein] synthase III C-terminal domain-containing protein [Acidimicrobiia bacterium]